MTAKSEMRERNSSYAAASNSTGYASPTNIYYDQINYHAAPPARISTPAPAPAPVVDVRGAVNRLLAFAEKYAKIKHLAFKGMSSKQFVADLNILSNNTIPANTKEKLNHLIGLDIPLSNYEGIYHSLKSNSLTYGTINIPDSLSILSMALQQPECNTQNKFEKLEIKNTLIGNDEIDDLAFIFKHITTLKITMDDNFAEAEQLLINILKAKELAGRNYHVNRVKLILNTLNFDHLSQIRKLVPADSKASIKISGTEILVHLNGIREEGLILEGSHQIKTDEITKLLNYIPANRPKGLLLHDRGYRDGVIISDPDITMVSLSGNKLFLSTVDDVYENILKNLPHLKILAFSEMTYINSNIKMDLVNMIQKLPNLTMLHLHISQLTDIELKALIPYIIANKNLTRVNLSDNDFSDAAIEELAKAIYDNDLRFTAETLLVTTKNKSFELMLKRNKKRKSLETLYENSNVGLNALSNYLAVKDQLSLTEIEELLKKRDQIAANIKTLSKMRYPRDEAATALQVTFNNLENEFDILHAYKLSRQAESYDMQEIVKFISKNISTLLAPSLTATTTQITITNILIETILSYVERHRSLCVHSPYIYNYSRPMTAIIQAIIGNPACIAHTDRAKAAMTDLFKQIALSTIANTFKITPPDNNQSIRFHPSIAKNHDLQILIKNIEVAISLEMFIQPLSVFLKNTSGMNYFNPNNPLIQPLTYILQEINLGIQQTNQVAPRHGIQPSAPNYEAGNYVPVTYMEYEEKDLPTPTTLPITVPHIRIPNTALLSYTYDHTDVEQKTVAQTGQSSSSSSAAPNQNIQSQAIPNQPYTRIKELIAQLSEIATPAELKLLEMRYPVDENFICKISLELMTDPVNDSAGDVFDRTSLEDYFRKNPDNKNLRCPLDDSITISREFSPNKEKRTKIIAYYETLIQAQMKIVNARQETQKAVATITSGASNSPVFTSATAPVVPDEKDDNRVVMTI